MYKDLLAIIQMVEDGATFTSQKLKAKSSNSEYNNFFTVIIDNADKLINIGAKIFVLDGTADIDPDYSRNFVQMIDCSRFKSSYSNLTVECINLNTSQSRLCSRANGNKVVKMIMEYLNSLPYQYDALFTYKSIAQKFKDSFQYIDYFGNIKGKNEYRDCTNIIQVGLNRYPDLVYRIKTLHNTLANVDTKDRCVKVIGSKFADKIKQTMYYSILTDIEQNLFRSKIRNADCDDSIHYTIAFNTIEFDPLIEMMRERYKGAKIVITGTPTLFLKEQIKSRATKDESRAQRIIDWIYEQPKGREFKITEMLNELGLSQQQFNDTKKHNNSLSIIFKSMAMKKRGYYKIN